MFYVLTRSIGDNWQDCWEDDGKPARFATEAEAENEIRDLLEQMPDYSRTDYIVARDPRPDRRRPRPRSIYFPEYHPNKNDRRKENRTNA